MPFYPNLRDETIMTLNVVVQCIERDSGYLDHPECPYSDAIKSFFRHKIEVSDHNGPQIDLFEGEDELQVLDTQVQAVINDLEAFGRTLGSADTSEKMGYFRTKTALIEKLVNMRERVFNLKEINDFKQTLLGFMQEELSKDQITNLMHKLDGVLGTKHDDF